jgi:DNA uptake protein ComE-like DNA-binding protein
MKHFTKLVLVVAVFSLTLFACKNAIKEDTKTETTTEVKEKTAVVEITGVLNANLATEEELSGIGLPAEIVTQIVEKRPFLDMAQFEAVLGSEGKEELYKKIFVPLNLNTTAEKDFKIIPGVGDRMAHEFEEYRPYTSVAQFKKEIGKYVDETEVARYLHYVFVPVELNTASEADIKALPGVGDRMAHEFEEYRPYKNMAQFRKEISKYVDDKELSRLERLVYLKE